MLTPLFTTAYPMPGFIERISGIATTPILTRNMVLFFHPQVFNITISIYMKLKNIVKVFIPYRHW